MPDYRFVAMEGASAVGELTALDRRLDFRLDRPSTLSFRVNAESTLASTLRELGSDVLVYRDGVKVLRCVLVSSRDMLTADSHYIEFQGVDYKGRLESRLVLTAQPFTTEDDVDIAQAVIDNAQALTNGDMGITAGVRPAGVPLTGEFPAGLNVTAAINLIANVDDGFDWDIGPELTFDIYRPRGVVRDRVLDYGGLLSEVDREFRVGDFANVVRASGDDTIASVVAGSGDVVLGRWEAQVGFPSVANSTLLSGLAVDALNRFSRPTAFKVKLRSGEGVQRWGGTTDIGLGDSLRLVVKSNRLDVNEVQRVQEISVSVTDDGREDVVLTLDHPTRTFGERISDVYDRLTELERQG